MVLRWNRLLMASGVLLAASCAALAQAPCQDLDGDGYLDRCGAVQDCNDRDGHVFPGALETCNGYDDDCDGQVDEGCPGLCTDPEHRYGDRRVDPGDGISQRQPSMTRIANGYAVTWHQPAGDGIECDGEVQVERIDEAGRLRYGPTRVAAPNSLGRASRQTEVVWTGSEFFVGFSDADIGDCTTPHYPAAYIQRLDAQMNSLGEPVEVSCTSGPAEVQSMAWTGRYLIVLWGQGIESPKGLYFSRFTPDGQNLDPCGVPIVTGTPPSGNVLRWNGQDLLLVVRDAPPEGPQFNSEIYDQRFTEDLQPLDPGLQRLTFSDNPSDEPTLVWADGEWGIAWAEDFVRGYHEIAFARLDLSGQIVDPPGIVQVTFGADQTGGVNKGLPALVWTGQEYGLFYLGNTNRLTAEGDIWLARIAADGTHLGTDALLTTDAAKDAEFYAAAWNGEDYGVAWQDSSVPGIQVAFSRMGCRCRDEDHDGFTSCAGNDCDDTRFDVNALATEFCGDGVDNDCNGLADCLDAAACGALGPPPDAVTGLVATGKDDFAWSAVAGADAYDVARGSLRDLAFEHDARQAACFEPDLAAPGFTDAGVPPLRDGHYYLVRSQAGPAADCRLGPWGTADDAVIEACP